MRPKTISVAPATADPNGICLSQTPTEAGDLTIAGALATSGVATLSPPGHISITSASNESGDTFTITGTDRYDAALTETITGPNATTTTGNYNFKTVTQVATDGAATGAITVGSANELDTAWIPVEYRPNLGYSVTFNESSAVFDYVLQSTVEDPWGSSFDEHAANPQDGIDEGSPVRAFRLKITTFVSGTLTYTIICG
jgi:hypothetical protein